MAYNTSHLFELSTTELKVLFDILGPAITEKEVLISAGDTRPETGIMASVGALLLAKCLLAMKGQPEFFHSDEWISQALEGAKEGGFITDQGVAISIEQLVED